MATNSNQNQTWRSKWFIPGKNYDAIKDISCKLGKEASTQFYATETLIFREAVHSIYRSCTRYVFSAPNDTNNPIRAIDLYDEVSEPKWDQFFKLVTKNGTYLTEI